MKRCPKCDFSFPDFHHVCDFDGTDLVDAPQTQHVPPGVNALAATQTPFRRMVKSPIFLIVLLLACVFSSLLLMVYRDAARHPGSIAKSQASLDSFVSPVPPAQIGPSRSEIGKPQAESLSSTRGRSATALRSRTRLRTSPSNRNRQTRSEIALQRKAKDKTLQKESKESALERDSKEDANRKDSKLTAALKTTWNILKKPFKF